MHFKLKQLHLSLSIAHKKMAAGDQPQAAVLTVKLISETIITANVHPKLKPCIFDISNLDRIMSGIPVLIFYAYRKPSTGDLLSVLNSIKASLSEALSHLFPFSGQIVRGSTGDVEILCNNNGVRLVEAYANISLSKLDLYNQNQSIRKLMLPVDPKFSLNLQITSYSCGGFSISWIFDHLLADASGFIKFLSAWCEIARTKKLISTEFNLDRLILQPRSPLSYNQLVNRNFSVCSMDDILDMPPDCATERHLYLVKGSTLESLRTSCSKGGSRRTRTEALSAYLWKFMAKTFDKCNHTRCKMGWAVDGRKRIAGDSERLLNFVGNVVSMAIGEESIKDLKEGSLAYIAEIVSRTIGEVANGAHFLDMIDFVESNRPGIMLPNVLVGPWMPAVVVSSCHNMPVMAMDFGFGLPSVGMFCSALDRLRAGYVSLVSRKRGDGSWLVSAFIWPCLAKELELDPDHVFEPITADHLAL